MYNTMQFIITSIVVFFYLIGIITTLSAIRIFCKDIQRKAEQKAFYALLKALSIAFVIALIGSIGYLAVIPRG